MSVTSEVTAAPCERRSQEIARELRAQWRMIGAVSLRPCGDGMGLEAEVRLDPVIVSASFEQQGYPRTPADLHKVEARRQAALEDCVARVNGALAPGERIRAISMANFGELA